MQNFDINDAKFLAMLRHTEQISIEGTLGVYLTTVFAPYAKLNALVGKFLKLNLIKVYNNSFRITDDGRYLLRGWEYLSEKDYFKLVLDRLLAYEEDLSLTDEEFISEDDYNSALSFSKKAKRKEQSSDDIFTIKNLGYGVLYAILLFLGGFLIGNFISGNMLGGLVAIPMLIALTILFYLLATDELKKAKKSIDIQKVFKKPVGTLICINGAIAVFSIVAFFVFDVRYFFLLLFNVLELSLIFVFNSKFIRKELPKTQLKTHRFLSKLYAKEYYVGGINILDDLNRVKQDGTTVILCNPITKSEICETDLVYKVTVGTADFFYAMVEQDKSVLIYAISKADYLTIAFLADESDFYLDAKAEALTLKSVSVNKEDFADAIYTKDGLVRVYSCALGDKFAVKVEFLEFAIIDGVSVRDTQFPSYLTDNYLISNTALTTWSVISMELFDSEEVSEKYLSAVVNEISYEDILVSIYNV